LRRPRAKLKLADSENQIALANIKAAAEGAAECTAFAFP
jgi:hypothetical protein